jgi:hypothetical protein
VAKIDLSHLNYNLEVKDETKLIYKRKKLKSNEKITMQKKKINKSCEGVEPLSKRTLHPTTTHDLDLQATC